MKLHFTKIPGPEKYNFLILHGLFGSGKNWTTVGNALKSYGNVWLIDARNHGDSPHTDTHTLNDMTEDLRDFMLDHEIENPVIIGHSMGGLTAMNYALKHQPAMPIVIVDIFPVDLNFAHENELASLQLDVGNAASRGEIDQKMQEFVADKFIRQFLQMNLEKTPGGYRWKINTKALLDRKNMFKGYFSGDISYNGEILFVMGEKSPYYRRQDEEQTRRIFPNARIEVIPDGTHYLHYANFEAFLRIVTGFLK